MKFSEKFKKNKGEAAAPEAAQDSGKRNINRIRKSW